MTIAIVTLVMLACLLFVALGAVMLHRGFLYFKESRQGMSWPTVCGAVVSSELERINSDIAFNSGTDENWAYRANITYRYSVNDSQYTSKRVFFGDESSGSDAMARSKRLVAKYSPGENVDVHFDPDNPANSVLEPKVRAAAIQSIIIGMVATISGLAFSRVIFRDLW
ncbi:MAG: hypothetical protein ACI9BW_002545 [Gammaproteobacteria bacterium]|jgi:hypothetical protein